MTNRPVSVWRSRSFLVQVFNEGHQDGRKVTRLTVARTELGDDGRWKADITWDELQQIKRECGFGNCYAIEVFPAIATSSTSPTCATCGCSTIT